MSQEIVDIVEAHTNELEVFHMPDALKKTLASSEYREEFIKVLSLETKPLWNYIMGRQKEKTNVQMSKMQCL